MHIAKRCTVTGRVQGVFYRASTQARARELGITGYAKNLPSGAVEVLAVGDAQAVGALIEWLWSGPPSAHVTQVEAIELRLDDLASVPGHFTTA